jgi:hypothetical protein
MNDFKAIQISFSILIASKYNSKTIPKSSSIELTWASGFVTSSLHFKHMAKAYYNASNSNGYYTGSKQIHS